MHWSFLLLCNACSDQAAQSPTPQTTPATTKPSNPRRPQGQTMGRQHTPKHPPLQKPPGTSAAEDLRSSWKSTLQVAVAQPASKNPKDCPDQDGDGFVSAQTCPYQASQTLDCDDSDASVTPKTELWIPPGSFIMGSSSSHAGFDEKPVHVVQLSGYCLDRTEVNSEHFSSWLQRTKRRPQGADIRNINSDGSLKKGREKHPAEGVTWQEANDYCTSLNKSLPTEAQWEKAARGGCELGQDQANCDASDLRPYPWGKQAPTCQLANHQLSTQGFPKLCRSETMEVDNGTAGKGPYGHLHMAGNIWEFVADYWHPQTYQSANRVDPGGPSKGDIHVLRGGSWNTFSTNMRVANRFHDLVMGSATGFRCARPTKPSTADPVPPLEMISLQGMVQSQAALKGRALYISAFDAADADANGMLAPGRSPMAESKLIPNQQSQQPFSIRVPKNRKYILSAALDAGTGGKKDDYVSASGSGGFGHAQQNPIDASRAQTNILIQLKAAPSHPVHQPHQPQHKR